MTERQKRYLDTEEIRDLSRRYMRGLDRLDLPLLASVFAPDATVDYGFYQGSAREFVPFAHRALKDHLANHHMLGQMLIEVDGASAVGEIYFQAFHRIEEAGAQQDLFISGRYVDRYRKQDDEWKILFRSEINDWSRTDPAADEFFRLNTAALRGARGADDASSRFMSPGEQR